MKNPRCPGAWPVPSNLAAWQLPLEFIRLPAGDFLSGWPVSTHLPGLGSWISQCAKRGHRLGATGRGMRVPCEGQGPSQTAGTGEFCMGGPLLHLILGTGDAQPRAAEAKSPGTLSAEPGHLVPLQLRDPCTLPGQTQLGKARLSQVTAVFTHRDAFISHLQNEHYYQCTFVLNIND